MSTNKLMDKLEHFFDLPSQKQQKKHHKLQKIISKLEARREELEAALIEAGKKDDTSGAYHDLKTELKVVRKLVKKAKKHVVHN